MVLGAWIWTFEYVPPGQVDRDMRANDVQFQEVVGKYSMGDGLGLNWDMEISSSGRFYLFWRGCLGIYGRSKGWIGAANGSFILHPNLDLWKVIRGIRVASEELIPVRWGERIYLIRKEKMVEFCSYINLGWEPRNKVYGHYYLRREDWKKPSKGRPHVPAPWSDYVLDKAVMGRLVELAGDRQGVVDVGRTSGLLPGMVMYAEDFGNAKPSMITVLSIEESRSLVECRWEDCTFAVGQGISTAFGDPQLSPNQQNAVDPPVRGASHDGREIRESANGQAGRSF